MPQSFPLLAATSRKRSLVTSRSTYMIPNRYSSHAAWAAQTSCSRSPVDYPQSAESAALTPFTSPCTSATAMQHLFTSGYTSPDLCAPSMRRQVLVYTSVIQGEHSQATKAGSRHCSNPAGRIEWSWCLFTHHRDPYRLCLIRERSQRMTAQ